MPPESILLASRTPKRSGNTIDYQYNDYEGWYIDNVKLQTASGNAPSNNEPSMTMFSTEYYYSSGTGDAWYAYRNDDGVWADTATNKIAGDRVRKHFRVDKQLHNDANTARLWILMANTGCSGTSEDYTHFLFVNNGPGMYLDPCQGPFTSNFKWTPFDIPMSRIIDGENTFMIEPISPSSRGFLFAVDESSPGIDSDIIDNGVEKSGELLWQLWIGRPTDYDVMYRFLVVETIDENGKKSEQYAMEGFAYYSIDDLDSMYFLVYDNDAGKRSRLWQTTTWQQNNDYQESNKHGQTKHWPHYRYDYADKHNGQGGRKAPVNGDYYHWYRVEWGTRAPDGTTTVQGRQVVLVDHVPEASKTYTQSPDKASKPNNREDLIDIRLNAYYKVDKVMNYGHKGPFGVNNKDGRYPWAGRTTGVNDYHAHDHIGFEINVFDASKAMRNAAKAADVADKIIDTYISWLSGLSVKDWVQKQMKISKSGALTSFFLTTLQTGNIAHITKTEFDTGSGGGTFPWTDNALHPIIPAPYVGPVMMAVDLIPQTAHHVPSHPNVADPPVEGQGESKSWSI